MQCVQISKGVFSNLVKHKLTLMQVKMSVYFLVLEIATGFIVIIIVIDFGEFRNKNLQ
jgi:hypothetical protein